MNKVLIDTDVILDFFFDRKPFSHDAAKILSLCEGAKIDGFVTSVTISNIYYILRNSSKHDKIIESFKILMNIIDVAIIDKQTVLNALNSEFKDFEDALQNFSAINESDIQVIITKNVKDYKTSSLAVITPENYLKAFR